MTFEDKGIEGYRKGTLSATTCPFCKESRKPKNRNKRCLTVNDVAGNRWYKCNHCTEKGNLDMFEKYKEVDRIANTPKEIPSIFSKTAQQWMRSKLLYGVTLFECGVYEDSEGLIRFPHQYFGYTVNVKIRNLLANSENGKLKQWQLPLPEGVERKKVFWLINKVDMDKCDTISIIEGETDTMTHVQCGYKNCISVPEGAPSINSTQLDNKFQFINDKYTLSLLEKARIIYLFTDNDEAGKYLSECLVKYIGKFTGGKIWKDKFRRISYPVGYKDSNEVYAGDKDKGLAPMGEDGLKKMYDNAKPLSLKGMYTVGNAIEGIKRIRKYGLQRGIGTGIEWIDSKVTIQRGIWMLLTGAPKVGKTTWLFWWLIKLSENNPDIKWAIFSREANPIERLFSKLIEMKVGLWLSSKSKWAKNEMTEDQINKAVLWLKDRFIVIDPTMHEFEDFNNSVKPADVSSFKTIFKYFKYLKDTYNIFGWVLDNLSSLDLSNPSHKRIIESETNIIKSILDWITIFNNDNNVFGLIVAHTTKLKTQPKSMNLVPYTAYDISGSAHFKNKTWLSIILERDFYKLRLRNGKPVKDVEGKDIYDEVNYLPMKVKIDDVRFEELGSKGSVYCYPDYSKAMQFFEYESDEESIMQTEHPAQNETFSESPDGSIEQELPLEFEEPKINPLDDDDIPF